MQSINEVYVGKKASMLEIEKQLGKFRSKYMGEIFAVNMNTDIDLIKLNRLLEKEFGFSHCCIDINNDSSVNACTIPVGWRLDIKNKKGFFKSKDGFKYDPKDGFALYISVNTGVIFNPVYTDGEVLALLLHEIGHNFTGVGVKTVGIFDSVFCVVQFLEFFAMSLIKGDIARAVLSPFIFTNKGMDYMIEWNEEFNREYPMFSNFIDSVTFVFGVIRHAMDELGALNIIGTLTKPMQLIIGYLRGAIYHLITRFMAIGGISQGIRQMLTPIGYTDEKFADNFPTIYGYGPELVSCFGKAQYNERLFVDKAFNQIPVLSTFRNILSMPGEILLGFLDEHPMYPERIKDQFKYLEDEMKEKNVDPKMRKRISDDIKIMNKKFDELNSSKDKIRDPHIVRKAWYQFMVRQGTGDFKPGFWNLGGNKNVSTHVKDIKLK